MRNNKKFAMLWFCEFAQMKQSGVSNDGTCGYCGIILLRFVRVLKSNKTQRDENISSMVTNNNDINLKHNCQPHKNLQTYISNNVSIK